MIVLTNRKHNFYNEANIYSREQYLTRSHSHEMSQRPSGTSYVHLHEQHTLE